MTSGRSTSARVSWTHAVVAVPVAVLAWAVVTAVLTVVLADPALSGMAAIGIVAGVGCLLLLTRRPGPTGGGLGAIATMIPCAIGLALSLL